MMKWLFYSGAILLLCFEILAVYLIMPMPGSQDMDSLSIAYFLHASRWIIRSLCLLLMILGFVPAWKKAKWLVAFFLLVDIGVTYLVNAKMVADHMFLQPRQLILRDSSANSISPDRLVIGIEYQGQAKAYPIQFIGYHHQVRDSIGGKAVIVTYCTVCRTGRVYQPVVQGRPETFRLVGMDHFNAMFEDQTTKSWWRQVTGEAVAGPLKGESLPEFPSTQTSLRTWLQLHPQSLIMQPDPAFAREYGEMDNYETGRREGTLTVYDSASWQKKSWVAGIAIGNDSKAYDWNLLKEKKVIHDRIGHTPVLLIVTDSNRSIFAYVRQADDQVFSLHADTLMTGQLRFDLLGHSLQPGVRDLDRVNVYQEYWHSWKAFHPGTSRFEPQ